MASFAWILLTEPSYKTRTLAGEESGSEDTRILAVAPARATFVTVTGRLPSGTPLSQAWEFPEEAAPTH